MWLLLLIIDVIRGRFNADWLMLCIQYEPELFPGLIYRMKVPKIVLLIFVSGKVVLTGEPCTVTFLGYNVVHQRDHCSSNAVIPIVWSLHRESLYINCFYKDSLLCLSAYQHMYLLAISFSSASIVWLCCTHSTSQSLTHWLSQSYNQSVMYTWLQLQSMPSLACSICLMVCRCQDQGPDLWGLREDLPCLGTVQERGCACAWGGKALYPVWLSCLCCLLQVPSLSHHLSCCTASQIAQLCLLPLMLLLCWPRIILCECWWIVSHAVGKAEHVQWW